MEFWTAKAAEKWFNVHFLLSFCMNLGSLVGFCGVQSGSGSIYDGVFELNMRYVWLA
jgi:hypothetical protein